MYVYITIYPYIEPSTPHFCRYGSFGDLWNSLCGSLHYWRRGWTQSRICWWILRDLNFPVLLFANKVKPRSYVSIRNVVREMSIWSSFAVIVLPGNYICFAPSAARAGSAAFRGADDAVHLVSSPSKTLESAYMEDIPRPITAPPRQVRWDMFNGTTRISNQLLKTMNILHSIPRVSLKKCNRSVSTKWSIGYAGSVIDL